MKVRLTVDAFEFRKGSESMEIIDELRDLGFEVSTYSRFGIGEPELAFGPTIYQGIAKIKKFIKDWREIHEYKMHGQN